MKIQSYGDGHKEARAGLEEELKQIGVMDDSPAFRLAGGFTGAHNIIKN